MDCSVYYITICLVILSTLTSSMSEYAFQIFSVKHCPTSREGWGMASSRLGCNGTHGYHCVPNKHLTSLIEFCYPRGANILFQKGNCLELAADGILNHVSCNKTFEFGCPDKFYLSNEIYKYPSCLAINTTLKCFYADFNCIYSKSMINQTRYILKQTRVMINETYEESLICGMKNSLSSSNVTAIVMAVIFGILSLILAVLLVVFIKRRNITIKRKKGLQDLENGESHPLQEVRFEQSEMTIEPNEERNDIVLPPQHISQLQNSHQLRTSIVTGDFPTFQYLIHKFDKHSLEEVDSNGFNCLHSAAKGGNLSIFKRICNMGVSVEKNTNEGSNILHIAAHHGCYPICEYILENHASLFSLKDNLGMNPAHYAANAGQYHILDLMLKQGCDLFAEDEKNNENIVHLACIGGSLEVCRFVKANKNLEKLLHAKNGGGWNSIQYATKNGHLDIVKFLLENGVDVKNKSKKIGKNCLHTACEFGKYKICEYIMSNAPNLITDTDSNGQHVGHYAAKNGHTDILQLLINTNKNAIQKASHDRINILHVACENAHYDMVVKIAKVYPFMVKEITEKGWNAAFFITNKADAEEERIKILKHLLLHGLDVYNVSKSGKTVLVNARKNNLKDIEHYLCEQFPKLIVLKKPISY
ncbi:serine/threonine-protein phosphatase 6 regulatory ankyrin repeat subunit A-like isoform X2 [Crassostrea angulata]|uniref:serine/threonine-protein phosphatase 6 regulatory ankyrin repeat subunit A-like isoform X2 n=1 Tax=Magallana angulata TaxID=2784310 RepID=UPI0022B0DA53|nr:serine/threonine-protein phosphatase 6 regulatory ankyrin repeat subunit A-like isoform X2 [Crassostrea angulata]